jgi:hypothetical protein
MQAKLAPNGGSSGVDTTKDMLQRSRHRHLLFAFIGAALVFGLYVCVQSVSIRDQNDDLRLIREAASSAAESSRDMEQCPADPVGEDSTVDSVCVQCFRHGYRSSCVGWKQLQCAAHASMASAVSFNAARSPGS